MNIKHITINDAWLINVTTYGNQVVTSLPTVIWKKITITDPGVCMNSIGKLKEPGCLNFHVVYICGNHCTNVKIELNNPITLPYDIITLQSIIQIKQLPYLPSKCITKYMRKPSILNPRVIPSIP